MAKSKVYFTKEITPESLIKMYETLGQELKGKVAVKLSTGEAGGHYFLNPNLIKDNDGYGFIECAHGTMSVPVPATSEIFANSNVKFRQIDIDTELVTPTGAAIIAELATDFTTLPAMVTEKIGWGTGSKDLKIPNVLKVYYGDMQEQNEN